MCLLVRCFGSHLDKREYREDTMGCRIRLQDSNRLIIRQKVITPGCWISLPEFPSHAMLSVTLDFGSGC